jgi:hypothetical protein
MICAARVIGTTLAFSYSRLNLESANASSARTRLSRFLSSTISVSSAEMSSP